MIGNDGVPNFFYREHWAVAIRKAETGSVLESNKEPFYVIPHAKNAWEADPFVFEKNGQVYIFAELYDWIKGKGEIAFCKWNQDRQEASNWQRVIEEPYHMSFPNIYERDGEIYLLPETSAAHTLTLYRAVIFPYSWEKVTTVLQNIDIVDTACFTKDNLFFAYGLELKENGCSESRIFRINEGEWQPESNSYSSDLRINRLAGKFFRYKGEMYRVSQDCQDFYGKCLHFTKWKTDADGNFYDIEAATITTNEIDINFPHRYIGIHTYNSSANFEVIDLKTMELNPSQIALSIRRALRKRVFGYKY